MTSDPIVEEIRAIREKIAAECDYDMHKIHERGRAILDRWPGKVVDEETWFRTRGRKKPPT